MRGESTRPGKRPLRALSASEKMDAIQRVHEGESKASVARDIGVPESTLRGWCKSEHKIRGMARNSSTPDSEAAHSPSSSSAIGSCTALAAAAVAGANNHLNNNNNNCASEDEGVPALKKMKVMDLTSSATGGGIYDAANIENVENKSNAGIVAGDKQKIDYMNLMSSMAGMRPENSSLLLQQLGLLSSTSSLAKSLLNINASVLSAAAAGHTSAVGLVENGLQYTKGGNAGNSGTGNANPKRHSISAIAPTQLDSVSKSGSRKSLPPAAEAPLTPVPASPRKTNENLLHHHQQQQQQHHQQLQHHPHHSKASSKRDSSGGGGTGTSSGSGSGSSSLTNKRADEALWCWLTQQQLLLGQQSAQFNPSSNQEGSWFWQWYKQCGFPQVTPTPIPSSTATATTTTTTTPVAGSNANGSNNSSSAANNKKSPSKARAMLDNVLCSSNNNNNENKRSGSGGGAVAGNGTADEENAHSHPPHHPSHHNSHNGTAGQEKSNGTAEESEVAGGIGDGDNGGGEDLVKMSTEEAIEHGEKFYKWLDRCSEPAVTRLQIMQFKYLLDNLKACKKKSHGNSFKQSRK